MLEAHQLAQEGNNMTMQRFLTNDDSYIAFGTTNDGNQPDNPGILISLFRSTADDGALVVQIDTMFEPNGSDGGPGLRVLINDAEVSETDSEDWVQLGDDHGAPRESLTLHMVAAAEDITYNDEDDSEFEMFKHLRNVRLAAEGESSDDEADVLREALEHALTKWNLTL